MMNVLLGSENDFLFCVRSIDFDSDALKVRKNGIKSSKKAVMYSGGLGDPKLGAQKILLKFYFFSCILTKNALKWRSVISQCI